jgi:DUF4097 and DUF4098 domain-containing protein YvlB
MRTPSWRRQNLLAFSLLALAATGPAAAGNEVRRSLDATPRGRIEIELFDGSVEVEGWDKNELQVSGSLARPGDELELERTGNSIEVEVESAHPGESRASLSLKVPRGSSVRIGVMSSSVEVRGVEGDVDIEAVAGNILVAGAPRKVLAQTVTGAIDVRTTGSEGCDIETVSGSIEVEGTARRIDANSVAGPIRLRVAGVTAGKIETVAGTVDAALEPGPHARFGFESFSSTILLRVPPALAARFELDTTSGRITSRMTGEVERRGEERRVIELGGGIADAVFRVESFSGDIELRPLDASPSRPK